jgi:hypothetical protein
MATPKLPAHLTPQQKQSIRKLWKDTHNPYTNVPPWLTNPPEQPPMTALPKVVINGREFFSDMRLKEFRAVDTPHHRISYDAVDTRPEAYQFGGMPERPFKVAYLRKADGSAMIAISPSTDKRPFFKDLPFLVRALARLDYLVAPGADAAKVSAASSPIIRAAVMNDILYKRALAVALNPDHPVHRKCIVDVSKDVDDFAGTGIAPQAVRDIAEVLPGRPTTGLGNSIIYTRRPDRSLHVQVEHAREGRQAFASYPLGIRLQARVGLFLAGSLEEYEKLNAADAMPPRDRIAVWDDVLCQRAAHILSRHAKEDYALARECDVLYGKQPDVRYLIGPWASRDSSQER